MNFSLFRHEWKVMFQNKKNLLFILFFLIAIFSFVFIILPNEEKIESFDVEKVDAEVKELESMQKARESRRHTGGPGSISFYSQNNYKQFLQKGMLESFADENYRRFMNLRTYYLSSMLTGNINIDDEEMFPDSPFPIKDKGHYINKKVRENQAILDADIPVTYEMIEGKTALQTMVTIFLSFGPFLILFTAIYFSNDILVRDRKQTTTVQGLPVSWYRYLNTKSVVAFSYTVVVLIALMTLTLILLSITNGFGSFKMGVPFEEIDKSSALLAYDYQMMSILKFFALTFSFVPIFMFVFIRLNIIFSLLFKNEWIVLILSSFLLFSEQFYYARDKRELFSIGIEHFPQTFFEFGKIVTGEKNFLMNMETLNYGKGILLMFISFIVIELLVLLSMKIINKERFFNI